VEHLARRRLMTNIALVLVQGVLLLRRYDTPIWTLIGRSLGVPRSGTAA
jgi:hypothetical protein